MNATTVTVRSFWSAQPFTIDSVDVYAHLHAVPDQRKRRGMRYHLAVLLTIALLAKLAGASQVRVLATWARGRAEELATLFGLERTTMPIPRPGGAAVWHRRGHRLGARAHAPAYPAING